MGIAIGAEHRELAAVARSFLEENAVRFEHRSQLDASDDRVPPFWGAAAKLGWLGLHLPESYGGSGYGFPELGVVVEEMGRAATPGPFLPTVIASALLAERGSAADCSDLLPGLADGTTIGGLGLHGGLRRQGSSVAGDAGVVLSGSIADLLLLRVGDDMVAVRSDHPGVSVAPASSLDRGRRVARVTLSGVPEADLVVLSGSARTCASDRASHRCRRSGRRGLRLRRDVRGIREGQGGVRKAHRAVPSGQAPLRQHVRPVRDGPRSFVGCPPVWGGRAVRRDCPSPPRPRWPCPPRSTAPG